MYVILQEKEVVVAYRKYFPVVGNRYNDYTIVSEEIKKIDGKICFDVECVCGKREFKQARHLTSDRCKSCKKCSAKRTAAKYGTPLNYKEEILGKTYFRYLKHGAKRRGIEFSISLEYVTELIFKQTFKCNLSGLSITLPKEVQMCYVDYTASLDRINNNLGYIEGNVQWVHKDVNKLKWAFTQERLLELCKLITENDKSRGGSCGV